MLGLEEVVGTSSALTSFFPMKGLPLVTLPCSPHDSSEIRGWSALPASHFAFWSALPSPTFQSGSLWLSQHWPWLRRSTGLILQFGIRKSMVSIYEPPPPTWSFSAMNLIFLSISALLFCLVSHLVCNSGGENRGPLTLCLIGKYD